MESNLNSFATLTRIDKPTMIDKKIQDSFAAVVLAAHRYLKPRGYIKTGATFRRTVNGNLVIVQLQKSAWNSADSVNFTVNFSIISHRAAIGSGQDTSTLKSEHHGHARARIGNFLHEPNDIWWTLDEDSDPDDIIAELLPLIEIATEFFEAHSSDEALAALWKSRPAGTCVSGDGRVWLTLAVETLAEN